MGDSDNLHSSGFTCIHVTCRHSVADNRSEMKLACSSFIKPGGGRSQTEAFLVLSPPAKHRQTSTPGERLKDLQSVTWVFVTSFVFVHTPDVDLGSGQACGRVTPPSPSRQERDLTCRDLPVQLNGSAYISEPHRQKTMTEGGEAWRGGEVRREDMKRHHLLLVGRGE